MSERRTESAWGRFWQGLFTYFSAQIIVKGILAIVGTIMLFWFLRDGR